MKRVSSSIPARRRLHPTGVAGGLLLACAVAIAPGASAVDDGGVRSVFARGAGNRALALGGAFAGLADDASTPVWNPAGLGLLERPMFYAAHTDLIGMGFSEQFGSLVVPHWRLGTACLTYRRFGVDGIEARDERNVLLGDDLRDAQTELALGFGRRLGDFWSLGALLKLQSQELAGYRDSGAGLDLGVWARPLTTTSADPRYGRTLTVGLALRNVIQPGLRLDQDTVDDPPAVRGGAAFRRGMGSFGSLLLTTDAEKTKGMDWRLHAGLEWQVLDQLALRGGSNAGDLAAGVGVRWNSFVVDYAFEDNPLETVHRMGLGLAFGATTAEKRQQVLADREREIQGRMTSVFERERNQQIDELLAATRRALDEGRPAEALDLTGTLGVLAPERAETPRLKAAAFREIGRSHLANKDLANAVVSFRRCLAITPDDEGAQRGLAESVAESDQRASRSAEIRRLFDRALQALADEDFAAARTGFEAVLARSPGDQEATTMLRSTEQTIRLRAGSLIEQGRALVRAGDATQAAAVLAAAEALSPAHPDLARARQAVADLQQRQTAAAREAAAARRTATADPDPAPAPVRPALSPARLAELADLYRRGLAAADQGRQDDAVRYWEMVWSAQPQYQQVGELLKREYLARGMKAFAAGDLDIASREWSEALRIDPDDKRARGYLARVHERQNRINEIRGNGR